MRVYRCGLYQVIGGIAVLLAACLDSPPTGPDDVRVPPDALSIVVDCDVPDDISDRIDALEADGTINGGQATALRAKLEQALRAEAEGRPDKVAEAYARLARQARDLAADGILSEEEAEALAACVEDVADGPDPDLLFTSVATGSSHACGLTAEGAAYCWGNNTAGELGIGDTGGFFDHPMPVSGGLVFRSITAGAENASSITGYTCGITTSDDTYCWGNNGQGQFGDGNEGTDSNVPVPAAAGLLDVASISAGAGVITGSTTCAVTTTGEGYCWGGNRFGKAGDPVATRTDVAVPLSGGLTFRSISAGGDVSCGLTTNGHAYCWGAGNLLGTGDPLSPDSHEPVAVSGGLIFQDLDVGKQSVCGVTTTGQAYCWGNGFWGQLGDGTDGYNAAPTLVLGGLTFESISVSHGTAHTCALTPGGDAYCWGANSVGELGNGDAPNRSLVPSLVAGGLTFETIEAGSGFTCAVDEAERAYCWGSGFRGRLGDGTGETDHDVPVPVASP